MSDFLLFSWRYFLTTTAADRERQNANGDGGNAKDIYLATEVSEHFFLGWGEVT